MSQVEYELGFYLLEGRESLLLNLPLFLTNVDFLRSLSVILIFAQKKLVISTGSSVH